MFPPLDFASLVFDILVAAGMRVRELIRERLQTADRGTVVGELPGRAQLALDRGPIAFGEVIEDVAFLVHVMPTSA